MIESDLFKRYIPNYNKLLSYGFKLMNEEYIYEKKIINNSFLMIISIVDTNVVGKIIDLDAECEYTNFRVESDCGVFSSKVKQVFIDSLMDIRDKCFDIRMFVSLQANRIGSLIYNMYNDLPFYEWESTPDTGVFKHKETKKWYAIIMNVKKCKISFGEELVDVINLKISPEKICDLLKLEGFYPAYHMNKKYWISVILDDTVSDDVIMSLISESYCYASRKK